LYQPWPPARSLERKKGFAVRNFIRKSNLVVGECASFDDGYIVIRHEWSWLVKVEYFALVYVS
jgi:hypothetical protein